MTHALMTAFEYFSGIEHAIGSAADGSTCDEDTARTRAADVYRLLNLFLRQSSAGEFKWRLQLLPPFAAALHALARAHPAAPLPRRLAAVVSNLHSFYSQYVTAVDAFVAPRRALIEKKLMVR